MIHIHRLNFMANQVGFFVFIENYLATSGNQENGFVKPTSMYLSENPVLVRKMEVNESKTC